MVQKRTIAFAISHAIVINAMVNLTTLTLRRTSKPVRVYVRHG
jgi:hypothetical protein